MRADPEVTLFHSPQTRSTGALILLEELHAPCTLQSLDLRGRDMGGRDMGGRDMGGRDMGGRDMGGRQEQRQPAFLPINPVPVSNRPSSIAP